MIRAERIPDVRAESPAGRELRAALWLRRVLDRSPAPGRFTMTLRHSPYDQVARILDGRGVDLCRVPRGAFRAWERREWIASIGRTRRGAQWEITDAGRAAAMAERAKVDYMPWGQQAG